MEERLIYRTPDGLNLESIKLYLYLCADILIQNMLFWILNLYFSS